MRNILLIIYLSLTPIFVATAATDIDSMECVLAKMPSGDRLVKLDELASDKGQGLDYKYYADRLLKEAELMILIKATLCSRSSGIIIPGI